MYGTRWVINVKARRACLKLVVFHRNFGTSKVVSQIAFNLFEISNDTRFLMSCIPGDAPHIKTHVFLPSKYISIVRSNSTGTVRYFEPPQPDDISCTFHTKIHDNFQMHTMSIRYNKR
jgi:hypothetical protein